MQLKEERFNAPELLFHPELVGMDSMGIHSMLKASICLTNLDIRKYLYQNMIVCGGTTCIDGNYIYVLIMSLKLIFHIKKKIKGFCFRLCKELSYVINKGVKYMIHSTQPKIRKQATWIGGTILSSLGI